MTGRSFSKNAVYWRKLVVFARTEQLLKDTAIGSQFAFPANCHLASGKTSRGENLLGYPWMVHDYPRLINRDEIFFRTQCWFGHGFPVPGY